MPVFIASLNSGSNGNCYYVGNADDAILVDAGIPCSEVEKRMQRLGLDIEKVRAILVSHEHTDHIAGVAVLSKKYRLPVFVTSTTLRHSGLRLDNALVSSFNAVYPFDIGGFSVRAFPKFHDASDPHSFVITAANITVGIFTDIGRPCKELVHHFKLCHAAFLESNYDEQMLVKGRYPVFLKNRIRGGSGHLSNTQAYELYVGHRPEFMTHLLLSHLSKENNSPEIVRNLFSSYPSSTHITVASRYEESPVLEIFEGKSFMPITSPARQGYAQLSLF